MDNAMLQKIADALGNLGRRVEQLEREPMEYAGVWEDKAYRKRTFVTHEGSVWYAKNSTVSRPGKSPDWILACKRGKDAR